jgi:hypothetical protein
MADGNPRVHIGANNPPPDQPDPYGAVKANIDDLCIEARNWADGVKVENQAQADEVSRLIEDLRIAIAAADKARVDEKKPYDDKIAEIQERYNALIADNKTLKGTAVLAMAALKATLKVYLDAEAEKQRKAAEEARLAAEKAAAEAAAAIRNADLTDLDAREGAEQLVTQARQAEYEARQIEKAKPQARGGSRAMGLRTTYTATLTDAREALKHYWATNRQPLIDCLTHMAQADVDRKVHTIPGVTVVEGTKL